MPRLGFYTITPVIIYRDSPIFKAIGRRLFRIRVVYRAIRL